MTIEDAEWFIELQLKFLESGKALQICAAEFDKAQDKLAKLSAQYDGRDLGIHVMQLYNEIILCFHNVPVVVP